jgi:hypothetical protein
MMIDRRFLALIGTCLAVAISGCGAKEAGVPGAGASVAYVQTLGGSDANDGGAAHPFRTISRCASTAKPGQTCAIHAGVYRETVIPNNGVAIRPDGTGTVWILSTVRVTHWKRASGAIFSARIGLNPKLAANQVFILATEPKPLHEAQWPPASDDPLHPNWAIAAAGTSEKTVVDPKLPNVDLTGAVANMWSGSDPWTHVTGPITSSGGGSFTFVPDGDLCPYFCSMRGGFYYVTGARGLLRAPGEWSYDATSHVLYLWAPKSADPNTLDIEVKQRSLLVDLSNRSNVTIANVSTAGGGIAMNEHSRHNVLDGITALYPSQVTHVSGKYSNAYFSFSRYPLDSGLVLDGAGNTLENSTVAFSATNGVLIYGSGNTVTNSLIHDVDSLGDYSAGVISMSDGNSIEHDTIYNTGRSTITDASNIKVDIGFNNLYNVGLVSADNGVMYFGGRAPHEPYRIHNNWVHAEIDPRKIVPPSNTCPCPWGGIYIDGGAVGATIDHNVVWHSYPGIFLHGGLSFQASRHDHVNDNTLPDPRQPSIWLLALDGYAGSEAENNRIATPVSLDKTTRDFPQKNNGPHAPGAGTFPQPGCSLPGCSSAGPPL